MRHLIAVSAFAAVLLTSGCVEQALADSEHVNESSAALAKPAIDYCGPISESCCGRWGDKGNNLGVGKFCETHSDCANNGKAIYCSSIENMEGEHFSFFCAMPCVANGPANQCGNNAYCHCENPFGCGCEPLSCKTNPFPGCSEGG